MNSRKSVLIPSLKITILLICISLMSHISYAIEPIATMGQPHPEQHAFLNNNSILQVVPTHVQIIDTNTGDVVDEFAELTHFSDVVFSQNGTHLAVMNHSTDPRMTTVTIWDANTRKQISQWKIGSVVHDRATFSPTQPIFATYLYSGIHLWNWQTGESLGKIERVNYPAFSAMRFSADGRHIILASVNKIEMWNVETRLFEGHFTEPYIERIEDMAVSPNGAVIAAFEQDSPYIYVWNVDTRQLLWKKRSGIGRIINTEFSSDSQSLYVANETSMLMANGIGPLQGWDDQVRVWDVKSGQLIDTFGTEFRYLNRTTISPDQKNVILHYRDAVVLWDTKAKQQQNVWADYPSWMTGLSTDGNTFISVSRTHIKAWDTTTQKMNLLISSEDKLFEGFAFSPDGKKLAIGRDPRVELRDLQTGEVEIQFPVFIGGVEAINFSPSGELIAVGNNFGQIYILDTNNPDNIQKIDANVDNNSICLFSKVAFSNNEEYLAASSYGNHYSIMLWKRDGNTFNDLYSWQEHKTRNESMLEFATTEDRTTVLATTGKDGINIWNLLPNTPELLTTLDGWHHGRFYTDNRFLLAKRGSELQIWDWQTDTLQEPVELPGYFNISQDGSVILTYTVSGQVQIWDGTKLLPSLPEIITDLPDNKKLVTLGQIKRNQLLQNFPNPFNPETWIPFKLSNESDVTIDIHSSTGELVRSISAGKMSAGDHTSHAQAVHWDGMNNKGEAVSSGIYFYTITAGDFSASRKMIIMK